MKKLLRIIYILAIVSWGAAGEELDPTTESLDFSPNIYLDEHSPSLPLVSESSEQDSPSETDEHNPHSLTLVKKSSEQDSPSETDEYNPLASPLVSKSSENKSPSETDEHNPLSSPLVSKSSEHDSPSETDEHNPLSLTLVKKSSEQDSPSETDELNPLSSTLVSNSSEHDSPSKTDEHRPLSLTLVKKSSEQDSPSEKDENIRHQRQIRFKSSYQELPKSLQNPFLGNGANTDTSSEYSYFVQVDLDDPPPSTALTTLPEGVKIYFPPVSDVIAPVRKAPSLQKSLITVEAPTFQSKMEGKDSSTSLLSSSAHLLTSSYSSLEDQDTFLTSTNKPVTSTDSSNLIGSQVTAHRQRNPTTNQSPHAQKNFQNTNNINTEQSSYLSYEENDKPKNSLVTQKRISTSRSPFVGASKSSSFKSNASPGKPFWRPPSSLTTSSSPILSQPFIPSSTPTSLVSHRQPTLAPTSIFGSGVTTTTRPSTRFPKTFPGSSTPSFFSTTPSTPFHRKQTTPFRASSPDLHSNTSPQPNQAFSTPLTSSQNSLHWNPTPKPQVSQFQSSFRFPTPSPSVSVTSTGTSGLQIPGSPAPPKSQTPHRNRPFNSQKTFSMSVGGFFNPGQNLVSHTKPQTHFPTSNGKSLLNGSPNVLQANKGFKRPDSGILSQHPPRDGKTRALVNSDNSHTRGSSSSSGPDYPTLRTIPKTGFDCASKDFGGYYADPETNCQVFHVCWGRRSASFLCPEGTLFNQQILVCDWAYNVQCSSSLMASFEKRENLFDNWGRNRVL
ncbi:mucin-2-like [Macrobrachium nipponense]|uniref:mucin-2-like n=1 Tax=Macrobrachium nipponense TaxID=159736 RepID=UPI0030C7F094